MESINSNFGKIVFSGLHRIGAIIGKTEKFSGYAKSMEILYAGSVEKKPVFHSGSSPWKNTMMRKDPPHIAFIKFLRKNHITISIFFTFAFGFLSLLILAVAVALMQSFSPN